jgi:hypothetical protein
MYMRPIDLNLESLAARPIAPIRILNKLCGAGLDNSRLIVAAGDVCSILIVRNHLLWSCRYFRV